MKSPDGRECSTWLQHQRIVLTGKKTTAVCLLNPQGRSVERVEVDGCAITEGIRCDWLVLLNDTVSQEEIYVELKGSHIDQAIKQLKATINQLSKDCLRLRKRCLVTLKRNPMTGTDVQKWQQKFRKDFNATFMPVRNKAEIPL